MTYTREQGKAAPGNAATFKKALGHDVAPESIIGMWLGMADLLAQVIADCDKAEAERDRAVACIEKVRSEAKEVCESYRSADRYATGLRAEAREMLDILAEYDKEAE